MSTILGQARIKKIGKIQLTTKPSMTRRQQKTRSFDMDDIVILEPQDTEDIRYGFEMWKASCMHLANDPAKRGQDLCLISPQTFPLREFGALLRRKSADLHAAGRSGVLIIRGFDFEEYTEKDKLAIHTGISSWIGDKRAVQNGDLAKENNVALHVIDMNVERIHAEDPQTYVATANMTVDMPFHSDSGDIISLHYRHLAKTGGDLFIASSQAIFDILRRKYPKELETLKADWDWHMPGNIEDVIQRPLVHTTTDRAGNVRAIIQSERRPFFGHPQSRRAQHLPPMTDDQCRALERIQSVARSVAFRVPIQKQDILYFNNLSVLHARTSFTDAGENNNLQRHVVRMVIKDSENSWNVPTALANQSWSMFDRVPVNEQTFSVFPVQMDAGSQHG